MKYLTKGRMLLVLGISVFMLLFSGVFVGGFIREASSKLEDEKAQLESERDRLKKIDDARADYEAQTKKFDETYEEMTARYPGKITQNNQIMFLKGVEDEFGLRIASASYTDPEVIYSFQYLPVGNQESYNLERSTLQFPMQLSYSEWKRFIHYIEETDGREVIETVTANYNADEDIVDVDVTLTQYAISGDDRENKQLTTDVTLGTNNIFQSTLDLSIGGEDSGSSSGSNSTPAVTFPSATNTERHNDTANTGFDTGFTDNSTGGIYEDSTGTDTGYTDDIGAAGTENAGDDITADTGYAENGIDAGGTDTAGTDDNGTSDGTSGIRGSR